jgi:hypothetical protein
MECDRAGSLDAVRTRSERTAPRGGLTARGAEARRACNHGPDAEVVDLFDRYLALFADATRRVGHLFPFNHLRLRMQSMLAGRVVRVIVRDDGAAVASFELEWCDGEFRRVASEHAPAFAWVVDMRMLEDAAERPWAYLAHPTRLGLAWFDAGRRVGAV